MDKRIIVSIASVLLSFGCTPSSTVRNPASSDATAESSSQPILYIGDSISYGDFGSTIQAALEKLSSNVTMVASCGSSPSTYLTAPGTNPSYAKTVCGFWEDDPIDGNIRTVTHQTPPLADLLNPKNKTGQDLPSPRVTIVQLGTNIAAGSAPTSVGSTEAVDKMMEEIKASGSKCIWIGPPDANSSVVTRPKLAATSQMISTEAEHYGCEYIDTLSFTKYPDVPGDGIHPAPTLAVEWGNAVDQKLIPLVTEALAGAASQP